MELIDRRALDMAFTMLRFNEDGTLRHWDDRQNWCMSGQEVEDLINSIPTIEAEPIVRCKDCEYWDTEWTPEGAKDEPTECHWCHFIDLVTPEDFFCAYGEMDDGTDLQTGCD